MQPPGGLPAKHTHKEAPACTDSQICHVRLHGRAKTSLLKSQNPSKHQRPVDLWRSSTSKPALSNLHQRRYYSSFSTGRLVLVCRGGRTELVLVLVLVLVPVLVAGTRSSTGIGPTNDYLLLLTAAATTTSNTTTTTIATIIVTTSTATHHSPQRRLLLLPLPLLLLPRA